MLLNPIADVSLSTATPLAESAARGLNGVEIVLLCVVVWGIWSLITQGAIARERRRRR